MAVAVALAAMGLVPPVAVGAEDNPTFVLPGATIGALTADLDGDGDREIVRLVQDPNPALRMVNAWEHDGDEWSDVGSAPLPRATDDDGAPTAFGDAAVALLLWRESARDRVLALSAAVVPDDPNGRTCCLTISEVQITASGTVQVDRLQQVGGGAQLYQMVDIDGDGTQELMLHESRIGPGPGDEEVMVTVMRWSGVAFETIFETADRGLLFGFSIADSDGVAGDDLLYGPAEDGTIRRLAWAQGGLRMEEAHIDVGERQGGWVVGVADGAIVLALGEELSVVRWPRAGEPVIVGRLPILTYPGVWIIDDGADSLIVTQEGFGFESGVRPTMTVHDLELGQLGEVTASHGSEGIWRLITGQASSGFGMIQRNIYPFSGPIPDALVDGRPAFASNGMLIQAGGSGGYEARPIASLIGVQPLGVAGPDDAWVVLGDGYSAPPGSAYLSYGSPFGPGRLAVTPLARLLLPDADVEAATIELVDAVEIVGDDGPRLLADGDGFTVVVSAPDGSTVIGANGSRVDERTVANGQVTMPIEPRRGGNDVNQDFDTIVLVLTPDGRGITAAWDGTFVREPPEIRVTAATDTMELSATLEGRASPGSQVTAGGQVLETDDEGRFAGAIDAPIWPSQVLVTARDPLGNEASQRIEVVGLIDYRGLPWAAILVVVTILAAGVLYVRTPKRRTVASSVDGDGRLEELELDTIDLVEPRSR